MDVKVMLNISIINSALDTRAIFWYRNVKTSFILDS